MNSSALSSFSAIGALVAALLCASAEAQITSDDCASAGVVGAGTYAWDNSAATTGTEGQAEGLCYFFGSSAIDFDVWTVYAAGATGTATVSICGASGTLTDSKIAAYPGGVCPTPGTALACNDDACGLLSEISFPVSAGQSYMLQLGSFPGASGGTASVVITEPPSGPQLWTHSSDRSAIVPDLIPSCVGGAPATSGGMCGVMPSTVSSSYWRLFDRSDIQPLVGGLSVSGGFDIIQVNFGVECADAAQGFMDVRINVFAAQNASSYVGREILDYRDITIPISTAVIEAIPICPPIYVPDGVDFIAIEVRPSATSGARRFFMGGNMAPQSPGFFGAVRAPGCMVPDPVNLPPGTNMILEFVSSQPVGQARWTQSVNSNVTQPNGVACSTMGEVTDNSFWRIYDRLDPLPPFSGCPPPQPPAGCPVPPGPVCVSGGFEILTVSAGIGLSSNMGSRNLTINVYEDPDGGSPGPLGSLVHLGGETFTLADMAGPAVVTFPFANSIFVPEQVRFVVVEVMVEQGGQFSIGSNSLGESPLNSSYVSSPSCGLNEPVPFATVGFPNEHMILNFDSRPMAIREPCIVPSGSDFHFPTVPCGYWLPDPLVIELYTPPPGSVPYNPARGLEVGVLLRGFDNVVEAPFGPTPNFPLGGVRSTFDCVMDLHFTGTGALAGLLDRTVTLRPAAGGTFARGLFSPTAGGTLAFATEIEDLVVEITPADMDRDFLNLRFELGTNNALASSGEAHLVEPPCTGVFVIGDFRRDDWSNSGEGMGHSVLQGGVFDPTMPVIFDVSMQIDPPSEDPSALTECSSALFPNSTGAGTRVYAVGSGDTSMTTGQVLTIVAEDIPPGQPGYFLVSSGLDFLANPAGSNGNFCLASTGLFPGRYNCSPCGQVGTGPTLSLDIWEFNLATTQDAGGTNVPPDPVRVPLPGETFYWQCWHRDVGNTNNFSDVVGVTFY